MTGGGGGAAGMGGQYIDGMARAADNHPPAVRRWITDRISAWPRQCELCRDWGGESVCPTCVARFAAPRPRCPRCALPSDAARTCGACLHEPPEFDSAWAVADYGFPWDRLITQFKFQQQPELARTLAALLVRSLPTSAREQVNLLVPMPLSDARLRERGYNQAWELARHLSAPLQIEARADLLLRLRDTQHQVGLHRAEREANLRNALWVDARLAAQVQGRHVALVDDVVTTGASANAAAHALRQAGAATVTVWMLARTPRG